MLARRVLVLLGLLFGLSCWPLTESRDSGSGPKVRQFLTALFGRALDLNRSGKWNEFIEEQHKTATLGVRQASPVIVQPVPQPPPIAMVTLANITATTTTTTRSNMPAYNQSFIDETKDPDSPYYIAMVSSNIGGNHHYSSHPFAPNRTATGSSSGTSGVTTESSSGGGKNQTGGFISKLFNYAFSTTAPSRAMQTPKRPLITYINVSNLEEHDSAETETVTVMSGAGSQSNKYSGEQLTLLNSADPGSLQIAPSAIKKRLPECATQQVCSAHYVKSNHTQRLCDCPRDYNWSCEDPDPNEEHTIDLTRKQELKTQRNTLEVYTRVKLCESLSNIKQCKTPTDWTIMALQSERTGKAHFVVVCQCPDSASFEGPFTHKHPPYARFPGIRVYGMLCNQGTRKSKHPRVALEIDQQQSNEFPEFPWELAYAVMNSTTTQGFW